MDEFQIDVIGRLSALEFVLEIMMANSLAYMAADASDQFKNDLTAKSGYIRRGPVDVELLQAIQGKTQDVLERFVEKVAERETQLRRELQ